MPKQLAARCGNGHQLNAVDEDGDDFVCPWCESEQISFSLVHVDDSLVAEVGRLGMAKAWNEAAP